MTTLNLVQRRAEPNVWDASRVSWPWDAERWLAAAAAGACLAAAFRRRSASGLLLALGGAGLAWWASTGIDMRKQRRERLRALWSRPTDWVLEASEESFPASDPPSWTGTTGHNGQGSGDPSVH